MWVEVLMAADDLCGELNVSSHFVEAVNQTCSLRAVNPRTTRERDFSEEDAEPHA
jgi:hypothetical protein